jgi:L-fucose mutarotase/ribose pyranase (RbsD/FucU family)
MREMIQILLFLLKLGFPLQSRNEMEVVDEEREPEIRITPRFTNDQKSTSTRDVYVFNQFQWYEKRCVSM